MSTYIIMGGIFVLIYFLMIRPQRRKMQAHKNLLSDLAPGDDILTTSGIYGRISSFDGDSMSLEIADDVYIKIARASIAQKVFYEDPSVIENTENLIPENIEEIDTEETSEDE